MFFFTLLEYLFIQEFYQEVFYESVFTSVKELEQKHAPSAAASSS